MIQGIILYGPPASGKDTITRELTSINQKYMLFRRLKVSQKSSPNYRMIPLSELDRLVAAGDIVWQNARYDAIYAVDTSGLRTAIRNHIPVLHLGQAEGVEAVRHSTGIDWLTVGLWSSRESAEERLIGRGSADVAARLAAWDSTESLPGADLRIDTDGVSPAEAAHQLAAQVEAYATRPSRAIGGP